MSNSLQFVSHILTVPKIHCSPSRLVVYMFYVKMNTFKKSNLKKNTLLSYIRSKIYWNSRMLKKHFPYYTISIKYINACLFDHRSQTPSFPHSQLLLWISIFCECVTRFHLFWLIVVVEPLGGCRHGRMGGASLIKLCFELSLEIVRLKKCSQIINMWINRK